MGVYNNSATLDDAIQSLLEQTCHEWKLIMCDDCSIDDTLEIATKYANQYENIMLIRNQENMGLNYTLNQCLKYVDTEYVARMDGDDISLPERLEKQINFLDRNKEYAIVSSNMIYFDENGEWGKSNAIEFPRKKDFVFGTPFCHAPSLVRTAAYRMVGGYTVDKRLLRVEDYHLWYKMYLNGLVGANLKDCLYKMRDDRNAIARRKYRFRLNEAYVKKMIITNFNLSKINYIHVFRPLLVGLLPSSVYTIIHKKRLGLYD